MSWTDTEFRHRQKVDVQLAQVVDVRLLNVQKVNVGYGNMEQQEIPGPLPMPRKPENG